MKAEKTIDERIDGVNRALERCEAMTRKTDAICWSRAFCSLLGVKSRLIQEGLAELTGGKR